MAEKVCALHILQEYFKTLGPTQLLAERGREILVINPGSAFLRIGLASQKEPLLIPHCIARYAPELARKRQKVRGGINEVDEAVRQCAAACKSESLHCSNQIEDLRAILKTTTTCMSYWAPF